MTVTIELLLGLIKMASWVLSWFNETHLPSHLIGMSRLVPGWPSSLIYCVYPVNASLNWGATDSLSMDPEVGGTAVQGPQEALEMETLNSRAHWCWSLGDAKEWGHQESALLSGRIMQSHTLSRPLITRKVSVEIFSFWINQCYPKEDIFYNRRI